MFVYRFLGTIESCLLTFIYIQSVSDRTSMIRYFFQTNARHTLYSSLLNTVSLMLSMNTKYLYICVLSEVIFKVHIYIYIYISKLNNPSIIRPLWNIILTGHLMRGYESKMVNTYLMSIVVW